MERCCPYCHRVFSTSRIHPQQRVCSGISCQRQRREQNRKLKLQNDPIYRESCRDSAKQWRSEHPGYWKQYRAARHASVEHNRATQQNRDLRRSLSHLANNNSAPGLTSFPATVWCSDRLLAPDADLANNNFAQAHLIVVPQLKPRTPALSLCKQQLSGIAPVLP